MADVIKTEGRWVFTLSKSDSEPVERVIANPYPLGSSSEPSQSAIDNAKDYFTASTNRQNKIIQPSNWRDEDESEAEWTTTDVRYELIVTQTRVFEPTA